MTPRLLRPRTTTALQLGSVRPSALSTSRGIVIALFVPVCSAYAWDRTGSRKRQLLAKKFFIQDCRVRGDRVNANQLGEKRANDRFENDQSESANTVNASTPLEGICYTLQSIQKGRHLNASKAMNAIEHPNRCVI
jgi:hypothetical protein